MENPWELIPCPDFSGDSPFTGFGSYLNRSSEDSHNSSTRFAFDGRTNSGFNLNSNASGYSVDGTGESSGFNLTFPCWPADIIKKDTFKRIVNDLNIYFTPIIIVVGATGNLMAFLVFTVTHLRRQSSSVFLASLALADLGYLLALLFVWLSWIRIPIFHKHVWCQLVLYMEAVFTFLSVW